VPLLCLTIFIYSVGYMPFDAPQVDPRYSRFFAYLSLFAAGMLGIVVFNNLLAFFISWEIMGTCAYLLLGSWREKACPGFDEITPREAGLKAFVVTKIGALFFMLGLALLYTEVGSLAYRDIFNPETLKRLASTPFLGTSTATVIALLLFGGAAAQSAQFPLHVWLPDTTEGPTPVLAMIHAATMASAGAFLVVRAYPLFQAAEVGVWAIGGVPFVAFVGAVTALGASLIAVVQHDVKGMFACSTISQLGYVIAALGIGAYTAGVFHLVMHAFCKTLLFLGAGSVIRGMERGRQQTHAYEFEEQEDAEGEREERSFDPRDMIDMGGLRWRMPRTFWAFLVGGAALSILPLITISFWSTSERVQGVGVASVNVLSRPDFWMLIVAAGLTAFYTARQLFMIFAGPPRTGAATHTRESAPSLTRPLVILAVFVVCLFWLGIPADFPLIGGLIPNWFHDFVGSAIGAGAQSTARLSGGGIAAHLQFPLMMGLAFALGGLLVGWLVYGLKPMRAGEMDRLEAGMRKLHLGWLHTGLRKRLYIDWVYRKTFVDGSIWLADALDRFDCGREEGARGVLDGLVNGVGSAGMVLSDAVAWFDTRVLDALVNRLAWVFGGLSNVAGWGDVHMMDASVNWMGVAARQVSTGLEFFDLRVIDGVVNGIGKTVRSLGGWIRPIQTGRVQRYLLIAVVTILALVLTFFMILQLNI